MYCIMSARLMLIKRFHIDLSRVCVSSCDEFGHMSSLIRVSSHVRTDAEDIIHFAESGSAGPWRDDTAGVRHRQQYVRSAVQLPAGARAHAAPGTGYVLIYDNNVLVHHTHLHNSCRLRRYLCWGIFSYYYALRCALHYTCCYA